MTDPTRGDEAPTTSLHDLVLERNHLWRTEPLTLLWLLRPCRVRVLLVTDGALDFGSADFGLKAFVKILQQAPFYVRYDVTLAHRRFRSGDQMLDGDSTIARRITNFRFDDPGHFASDMYDVVWLFGIESGPGIDDTEVRAIAEFMDGGGGLFATGDHGSLGKAMSSEIPRVRSMRLWDSTDPNPDLNEVSMQERRRNDTNRIGSSAGSQFNDQSDDVPQVITPKLYRVRVGIWRAVFPHPLLCGPRGTITVMPDHPHEGEGVQPADLTQSVTVAGATFEEFPAGTGGNPQPVPEVISTSSVLAGTTSSIKDPTDAHTFGGICAYDGHRASVGRVVTDPTWHHFVNVNLVGELGATPPKDKGFLATSAGEAHLEDIKAYYRNLATWLSSPTLLTCMRRRVLWWSIVNSRVVEAVSIKYDVRLQEANLRLFRAVGKQARDALGLATSSCQRVELAIDLIWDFVPLELVRQIDPWWPEPEPEKKAGPEHEPDLVPWFSLEPLLDAALGGSILALRDHFFDSGREDLEDAEEEFDEVARRGVEVAVARALEDAAESARAFEQLLVGRPKGSS